MAISIEFLAEQLELAERLEAGRLTMREPQDLPGRYGRVIRALDHLLQVTQIPAVLAGGWAVWYYGFIGRITQDVDIVLPADQIQAFMSAASVAGFTIVPTPPERWPKLVHKETGVRVDILPEGARPGVSEKVAPTVIPHPVQMGAARSSLRYIRLPSLIELKLAAARPQDLADVVELIIENPALIRSMREHLEGAHAEYVKLFDRLTICAHEQKEER